MYPNLPLFKFLIYSLLFHLTCGGIHIDPDNKSDSIVWFRCKMFTTEQYVATCWRDNENDNVINVLKIISRGRCLEIPVT